MGKPNVGKSTLFNTMIGRREAIVGEEHGLTRDFQEIEVKIEGNIFKFLDTAGIGLKNETLNKLAYSNTINKVENSDLIFFLIDGSKEMTIEDYNCANFLRKYKKKVVLIVNKIELRQSKNFKGLGYELGFGKPIGISAKNKSARLIINEIIKNSFDLKIKNKKTEIEEKQCIERNKISISISGKPNVGKSTIFNNIYGSNRVIVSEEAGTTRDSVKAEVFYENYIFDLVDTAGVRKKSKIVKSDVEKSSNYFSRKEIR